MRHVILRVVFLFVFVPFLFSGVIAFAVEARADAKNPVERCIKGGKTFSNAKTKNECIDKGGAWVNVKAPMRPPDPLEKSKEKPSDPFGKSRAMPDDPFGKSRAIPPDPLGKGTAMPPANR